MANTLNIPGFAVLCRVAFPIPRDEGAGYFCALAVPALNEEDACAKAAAFLDLPDDNTLSIAGTRPLSDAESDGLTSIRSLGPRIHFDTDADNA